MSALLQTAIAPDEILVEIRVPATAKTVAYVKTEQKASGFALAGVAVVRARGAHGCGVTGVAAKATGRRRSSRRSAGIWTAEADCRTAAVAHAGDGG